MFMRASLNNMNQPKQVGFGRTNMSALSMSAAPRISRNVTMNAVKDNHMDSEMSKTFAHGEQFVQTIGDGLDQRVEFLAVQKYSPWHDVDPSTDSPSYINCVIEIVAGTKTKYEVATKEDFNSIAPDVKDGKVRTLEYRGDGDPSKDFKFSGMPHAYGMIPRTFEDPSHKETVPVSVIGESQEEMVEVGGDEDPIDIFVISDRKIPMGQIKCKVIGVIHFVDDGEIDYKVICVDADFKDIDSINEMGDLKKTSAFSTAEAEIENWLKYYKSVDNDGKRLENAEKKYGKTIANRPTDSKEALKVIEECRAYYDRIVNSKETQEKKEYKKLKWTTPTKAKE